MKDISTRRLGDIFTSAFHLNTKPIAIYGSDTVPEDAVHISSIHRCIAVAMFRIASQDMVRAAYLGDEAKAGCCPGGLTHMGYAKRPEYIRYFISTGKKDNGSGSPEYLKASPELVDACFSAIGQIRSPGKNLVIQTCETIPDTQHGVRSICCFGNAEQIRNLAALVHFDRPEPFFPVLVPWGPACATFITYPAGMAEKSPKNAAFMGPQDPTFNWAFPADFLGIGIPIEVAMKMGKYIGESFVLKRPKVAFPSHEKAI